VRFSSEVYNSIEPVLEDFADEFSIGYVPFDEAISGLIFDIL